jgi:hypothetical protein
LGIWCVLNFFVARVFALRRKGQQKIARLILRELHRVACHRVGSHRAAQARAFQNGQYQLFGRARVSRALQHYQLPGAQVRRDRFRRAADVRQVRLAMLVERRGHADDHRVAGPQAAEIGAGLEALGLELRRNLGARNVPDVAFPARQRVDFRRVNIKPGGPKSLAREQQRQRQTHIAQTHQPYPHRRRLEFQVHPRYDFFRQSSSCVGIHQNFPFPKISVERPTRF